MDPIVEHVKDLIANDKRIDVRKLDEFRKIELEYGVTENAEGSARVKIGETEIVAGVKLSIEQPYSDTPDDGGLMVGAELLPLSNPEFEPGPPGIKAIELARITDRGLRESKAIDTKKLCIIPGEKVWFVAIDLIPINASGNLFDAASLAAIAALKNTKFPKLEDEKVNYKEKTETKLPITKEPVSITVTKIRDKFLIDPNEEEENAIEARLTVAFTKDGNICAMQKGEKTPLSIEDIDKMIEIAKVKAKELRSYL